MRSDNHVWPPLHERMSIKYLMWWDSWLSRAERAILWGNWERSSQLPHKTCSQWEILSGNHVIIETNIVI